MLDPATEHDEALLAGLSYTGGRVVGRAGAGERWGEEVPGEDRNWKCGKVGEGMGQPGRSTAPACRTLGGPRARAIPLRPSI